MSNKYISHGPFIGHQTTNSVKVWFRSSKEKKEIFLLRLYKSDYLLDFREVEVVGINDYIGCETFVGLEESISYQIKFFIGSKCIEELTFKTKSENKGDLHFVFGSCRYNHWHNFIQNDAKEGDQTYEEILKLHSENELDFLLFLGDQIYSDPTYSIGVSESFEDYSETYQEAFCLPNFQKLLSMVPAYMILDDHEIRDNWSRDMLDEFSFFENREEMFRNGIKSYELWQHNRNPETVKNQYWYHFEQSGHPFFVMDTRTQRRNNTKGSMQKTMLGNQQLEDLFKWLLSSKDKPVRFIGSGVPFCPDYKKNEDKWCAFTEERNLILEFLRIEGIGKTVFLSGDVHIGMFSSMTCVQDDQFKVFNLVSSPLHWPYRGMYVSDFLAEKTLVHDQYVNTNRRERGTFEYNYLTTNWLRENQFAEVSVTKDGRGKVRHFDMKEREFGTYFDF